MRGGFVRMNWSGSLRRKNVRAPSGWELLKTSVVSAVMLMHQARFVIGLEGSRSETKEGKWKNKREENERVRFDTYLCGSDDPLLSRIMLFVSEEGKRT